MLDTPLDFPNLLLICVIVALILTISLTKMIYHHDICISYLSDDGAEMTQFFIFSFEKEIPWTVLRDAASVFLNKSDVSYISGSEVIIGSNSVALKRVFHPFWKNSNEVVQGLMENDRI